MQLQPTPMLIPLTDLRRHAGKIFNQLPQLKLFIILKDGRPVGKITPMEESLPKSSLKDDLKKIRQLAGGFRLGINLTPKQMNEDYDKMYDQMLPR